MFIGSCGLGLLGMVVTGIGSLRGGNKSNLPGVALVGIGLALVLSVLLTATGCGSYNAPPSGTPRGTSTVMITGTSGSITHSTSVTLIVQ
jgi:hypothetical protein